MAAGAPRPRAADDAGRRKAEPCGACHGATGNSSIPTVPSLAGQPTAYLHWQLVLFRDGRRKDAQMTPLAAALSDTDMAELAAFYASQKPVTPARVPLTPAQAEAGRALAERHFCFACHGAALEGREYAPRLSTLQPDYLTSQLRRFKAGTRGDLDGAMTTVAQPLTDDAITELARFIAGMPIQ
ncbi:MAG TPA: c-type cytochrome [Methylomirabilota bacterium]|nr:c-type cytochrome [Methylomirabilota bacterium]